MKTREGPPPPEGSGGMQATSNSGGMHQSVARTVRWGVNMQSSITTSKGPGTPLHTLHTCSRLKQTLESCALTTAAVLAPGIPFAADAEEAATPVLQEVVVTANRREESASKV